MMIDVSQSISKIFTLGEDNDFAVLLLVAVPAAGHE